MSVPIVLFVVALILALVEELQANGKSLIGYAAILIAVGLLWGRIG